MQLNAKDSLSVLKKGTKTDLFAAQKLFLSSPFVFFGLNGNQTVERGILVI